MQTSIQAPQFTPTVDEQTTQALGKIFWLIATEYNFTPTQIKTILDIYNPQTYSNYKKGKKIRESGDSYRRVGHLLGIKKNLEILYPRNPEVCAKWLSVKRKTFHDLSAVEFISEVPFESFERLAAVRRLLDRLRNGSILELL